MYGDPFYHSSYPSPPAILPAYPFLRFAYPAVDIKTFEHSIKAYPALMKQGSLLLGHLSKPSFARRLMIAAQQGKQAEVEKLIKMIGLKVPVVIHYTPEDVIFTLHSTANQYSPMDCCKLSISLKWGQ